MSHFDKITLKKTFNQVAHTYESAAIFYHEIADRLLEHLDYMRLNPARIIDLGAGTGYMTQLLKKRYPYAQILAIDFAKAMLQQANRPQGDTCAYLCADVEEGLPFQDGAIDLVVSSLMLPWCQNLEKTCAEIQRTLKPGGLFLFSTLGPDTLGELRASWATVDDMPHAHLFFDLHDVGDALLRKKFAEPVIQTEWLTFMYDDMNALHQDLKNTGSINLWLDRRKTLTGKKRYQQFLAEYQTYKDKSGKLPATFEIIYAHCWKPNQSAGSNGEIAIPISAIKRSV